MGLRSVTMTVTFNFDPIDGKKELESLKKMNELFGRKRKMEFKVGAWFGMPKWFYINKGGFKYLWQDGEIHNDVEGYGEGRWYTREEAEQFLTNYKEKQMSDTEIRLEQVTKDIKLLEAEAAELAQKIEREKEEVWRFGDIADHYGSRRMVLYNDEGKLGWFSNFGKQQNRSDETLAERAKSLGYIRKGNLFNR